MRFLILLIFAFCAVTSLSAQPPAEFGNGNFADFQLIHEPEAIKDFTHQSNGGEPFIGVAWFDYNNDGLLDIYAANGIGYDDGLLRNNGDGTFTNVSVEAGLADGLGSSAVVAGDLDNDGNVDLYVSGVSGIFYNANASPSRIFKNNGDGTFTNVTADSGIQLPGIPGEAMHASLADIDNDGLLDLFVAAPGSIPAQTQNKNHLYHNKGNFRFEDISASSGVDYGLGACTSTFTDYDGDGWIDFVVGDCGDISFIPGTMHLFRNNGDLTFTERTNEVGLNSLADSGRGLWMSTTLGDYDNDGDMDLFATNVGLDAPGAPIPQDHIFYERNTNGTYTAVETYSGLSEIVPEFSWGAVFADFNNDGWEDLLWAGGMMDTPAGHLRHPGALFANMGRKKFKRMELPVDLTGDMTIGVAKADYNNDGYEDVLLTSGAWSENPSANPILLRAKPGENRYLTVRLEGRESNRDAIGARVVVELDGRILTKEINAGTSILSSNSPWLTFGLNRAKVVNKLTVYWPSGAVEEYPWLRVNQRIHLIEGEGMHCM